MSRPTRVAGMRGGLVFAVLAVGLAAAAIALFGGGRQNVTPTPTASPSSSVAPSTRFVQMLVTGGDPLTVEVVDTTGFLVDATSRQPGGGASFDVYGAGAVDDPVDPSAFDLTWSGQPCDATSTVLVDEARKTVTIVRKPCEGDTILLDRVLHLRFAGPVDANAYRASVVLDMPSVAPVSTAPSPSGPSPVADRPKVIDLPPLGPMSGSEVHVRLKQCCGDRLSVDVDALGYAFASATSGPAVEGVSVEDLMVANIDDRTLRVTWPGSPCDTVHRLTFDRAAATLTVDRPFCAGDSIGVDRVVILKAGEPIDGSRIRTSLVTGRGGDGFPNWTTTGIDSAGDRFDVALFDQSVTVSQLEPRDAGDQADPGEDQVAITQVSPEIVRLVWSSRACQSVDKLNVDATGTSWSLYGGSCPADDPWVLRALDVTYTGAIDASSISITKGVDDNT
jgi:hypothetical protein